MSIACCKRPADAVAVAFARHVVGMDDAFCVDVHSSRGCRDGRRDGGGSSGSNRCDRLVGMSCDSRDTLVEVARYFGGAVIQREPVFTPVWQDKGMSKRKSAKIGIA